MNSWSLRYIEVLWSRWAYLQQWQDTSLACCSFTGWLPTQTPDNHIREEMIPFSSRGFCLFFLVTLFF